MFGRSSLPERTTFRRMPRSKWPEATRTKAMRSRCAGSMLAWILKTTPLNFFSSGCDGALDGDALARRRRQVDERVEHLAHAEVVDRRAEEHRRLPAGEEGVAIERRRGVGEQLDLALGLRVLRRRSARRRRGSSRPARISSSLPLSRSRSCPPLNTRICSSRRSITPWKCLPMPTGQVNGTTSMPSSRSISSISTSGSCTSRSILLTKVRIGVLRARQTCSRRRVCGSTPLAASMTISAASTAVSTR